MPIAEHDPWRMQYFEGVACPENLVIPTDDETAWELFPEHAWVYNKLTVCQSQGLPCAPHGVPPRQFPVFSKPIYNMRGMGIGGEVVESAEDLKLKLYAGYMWMPLFEGDHVSTDVAVVDGEPVWWRHTTGTPLGGGMFDYWTVEADPRPELEAYCGDWLRRHLKGYAGMVNMETIGGRIIEVHLRFGDQWPDLYGPGWVEALVELYRDGTWSFQDRDRRTGYSVVLFGAHGLAYSHPGQEIVDEILGWDEVSSVQITFHEDWPPEAHAMPPGGFRLAIVNCFDLDAGRAARDQLALKFWSTQQLGTTAAE